MRKNPPPITVKVKPLTPPVWNVFNSLQIQPAFGGVNITFQNKDSADIAIVAIAIDSFGTWVLGDVHYTNQIHSSYSIHGYSAEKRKFGVYVRDRWNNYSDTLVKKLTPLYEVKLDKSKFKAVHLPGDAMGWGGTWPGTFPEQNLWDGIYGEGGMFLTDRGTVPGFPFTIDLGEVVRLSRYRQFQRTAYNFAYNHSNAKKWEIWGSLNPSPDGSWNGWTKLGEYQSIKPSGLPLGQLSDEDRATAQAGEEFSFSLDDPLVRYLRFKVQENWAGTNYVQYYEMTFYGQPQ